MRPLLLLAFATLAGCMKPASIAGQPYALFPEADNPAVIWLVRPVATERDGAGAVTLWGLFACYRYEQPMPPNCYLAKTTGTEEDLVWPDDPRRYFLTP